MPEDARQVQLSFLNDSQEFKQLLADLEKARPRAIIPYELHTHFPDESIIVVEETLSVAYKGDT